MAAGKPTPEEGGDAADRNVPAVVADGDLVVPSGPGCLRATVPALVTSPVCSPAQILSGDTKLTAGWGDQFEGEVAGGTVWFYYDFCNDNQGEDLDLAWSR